MDRQYVGIDFHRRRSVIVRLSSAGERLAVHRVDNDPFALSAVMGEAGTAPAVVIEATYGWYWAVDLLQELGAAVHLASPKSLNWGERRVKNDVADATDLADMLRLTSDVERVSGIGLHPVSKFKGLNARFDLGILPPLLPMALVELLQQIQLRALLGQGAVVILDVLD